MDMFGTPPADLDLSLPIEPMKLDVIGEQRKELQAFISELLETHPTKLKKKEKDKLRDTYRQLLLNVIYNSIRRVYTGVPRGKHAYAPDSYWRSLGLTYSFTVAALDRLVTDGYLEQQHGFLDRKSGIGKLTRIYAKDKLADEINAYAIAEHVHLSHEAEALVFRDFKEGDPLLDRDHPDLQRLRVINDFLNGYNWLQKGPIRLIYNSDPLQGGRVYTRFQNLKRRLRAEMRISGRPVVELDYKANHLAMLIALAGEELPSDPYLDISVKTGQSRDKVKKFITVSISASSEEKAFAACRQYGINRDLFVTLRNATSELFPGVPLFVGIGKSMQSLEGQVALDIMAEGANAGIPVLPVHDSFITTVENELWLREQMSSKWRYHLDTTEEPKIEKK